MVDAGADSGITFEELQLSTRNHGLPLEALRYAVTPPGLHYVLLHYDIPAVEAETFRLEIRGLVSRLLTLSLADLRGRPTVEITATMECAGNGRAHLSPHVVSQPWIQEAVGTASWRGTPLAPLLGEAGLLDGVREVVFGGLDHGVEGEIEQRFERSLPVAEALGGDALLAWEMNGQRLAPQHGFPLRLVVPGWYGMTNVKWLTSITAVDRPFHGYQQSHSYRLRQSEDEEGEPLTRIRPRALMIPPGIPEFLSRERRVPAGPCLLQGRAWSGWGQIAGVDVSTDGGETWEDAVLEPVAHLWAWRAWSYRWEATPGRHSLACRARDGAGNTQPLEALWNLGGYANNAVQHVAVTVQ